GDAVVEEAGILQSALGIVNILFVQRPADTLDDAALDLAFDVVAVDGAADILRGDEAQYGDAAGFRIDLDVAKLGGETGRLAAGIDGGGGTDRAAGQGFLAGDLLERHRLEVAHVAAGGLGVAVFPDHAVGIDAPDHRGAPAAILDDGLRRLND